MTKTLFWTLALLGFSTGPLGASMPSASQPSATSPTAARPAESEPELSEEEPEPVVVLDEGAAIALGERLFFDPGLSADGTVSCASCHEPEQYFADSVPLSAGVRGQLAGRHTPSLLDVADLPHLFWDGRSPDLEDQVRYPVLHPREMASSQEGAVEHVRSEPAYLPGWKAAFGDTEINWSRLCRALASFERTLRSGPSAFDRYQEGDPDAISESARRGFALFAGEAGCTDCHTFTAEQPHFTDFDFHNTGVGWATSADLGRWDVSKEQEHKGAFRTPGLRNVARTAPYMHDGSLATLAEVIDFYAEGGEKNQYLDPKMTPLDLDPDERADLVAFLESLTGEPSWSSTRVRLASDSPGARADGRVRNGSDWPRFLGRETNGKSAERGLHLRWPASGPKVLWQVEAGKGYGLPVTSAGRLFFFDREGDQARLRALDAETGTELWRTGYTTDYEGYYEKGGGPAATPVVDGGYVYTYGVEGRLQGRRVDDGALVWEVDTRERFGIVQNFFGVGSSPWIEGDLLIAQVGGSPRDSPSFHSGEVRGNGSGVVAFDKRTGAVRYQLSDELASYSSPRVAEVAGRRLGLVLTRGGLLAFEPDSGEQVFFFPWRDREFKAVNASTPVVVGDTVFVSESYGIGSALLRILPEGTGEDAYEVVWSDDPKGEKSLAAHWNTPIYHEGYLYGSSGRHSGDAELRAIDYRTGEVMWSYPGLNHGTVLFADGHLVVVTEYGRLLVVEADPSEPRKVAEVNLGKKKGADGEAIEPLLRYPVWNSPVLSHGLLYVRGSDRLVCFDLRPEKPVARASLEAASR